MSRRSKSYCRPIHHALFAALTSCGKQLAARFLSALLIFAAFSPSAADEAAKRNASANLLEAARSNLRAGNFDGALAALDRIVKMESGNADALDLRGMIYLEQGKFDEAKKAFRAANEPNRGRFLPQLHFGDVLLREKKFAEAREAYEKLLRETNIPSSSEQLRYAILLTYLFAHDRSGARAAFARVKFPTETPAYYYAQAAWEFAHNRPKDAREWIKAANRMFDLKTSAWFAQPLYAFGWGKEKPPLVTP